MEIEDFESLKIHVLGVLGTQTTIEGFIKMLRNQARWCDQNKDIYGGK